MIGFEWTFVITCFVDGKTSTVALPQALSDWIQALSITNYVTLIETSSIAWEFMKNTNALTFKCGVPKANAVSRLIFGYLDILALPTVIIGSEVTLSVE